MLSIVFTLGVAQPPTSDTISSQITKYHGNKYVSWYIVRFIPLSNCHPHYKLLGSNLQLFIIFVNEYFRKAIPSQEISPGIEYYVKGASFI
jgi:hypothetical protein